VWQTIAELDADLEERKDESGESQKYEKLFARDQEMTEFIESYPGLKAKVRRCLSFNFLFLVVSFLSSVSLSLSFSRSLSPASSSSSSSSLSSARLSRVTVVCVTSQSACCT
jgi:hypothetical protein